ncbi:hypothetical protein K503DRAFT_207607 [Rhizopogon vinicolor AM-OR11-026]|uniref:Uncharacterized protein n=1 Tax=Rhizopogon vinicolor AM-OR11-026 TaxID=1314800 RepID=A0A1B7MZ20_9AGAM|nr:hypothetical protein K503DRAFT_207607 [Rhizopogon vinicolor AM-OR11-026]
MTVVSNDPIWWPVINSYRIYSYAEAVSFTAVIYDWVLTFEQVVCGSCYDWSNRCTKNVAID